MQGSCLCFEPLQPQSERRECAVADRPNLRPSLLERFDVTPAIAHGAGRPAAGQCVCIYVGMLLRLGTYEFDGRVLTIHSSPDVRQAPCAGLTGTYPTAFSNEGDEVRFPSAGASDPCAKRMQELTTLVHSNVEP